MNEIIQIPLAHPKSHLDELRRAFGVPEKYTDELLLQSLVGIVIDDYMNVEKIEVENLQDVLTDGRIADRWIDKELCPHCEVELKWKMIDIDGTNLEEHNVCPDCGYGTPSLR